jgi:hypothetical protein
MEGSLAAFKGATRIANSSSIAKANSYGKEMRSHNSKASYCPREVGTYSNINGSSFAHGVHLAESGV